MKNLIYSGIYSKITVDLLVSLSAHFPELETVTSISAFSKTPQEISTLKFQHQILRHEEVMMARYPYEPKAILDPSILDQISPYWLTLLKMMDRISPEIGYSFEARMKMLLDHVRYWNHLIDSKKIDCFISHNDPHEMFDYAIYALCKAKGVQVLFFTHTQLNGYMQLIESIENPDPLLARATSTATSDNIPSEIALPPLLEAHFSKQTSNQSRPFYLDMNIQIKKNQTSTFAKLNKIISRFNVLFSHLKHLNFTKLHPKNILKILYYSTLFGFSAEKSLAKKYASLCSAPDFSKKYIYVPLHYQPESSTSPEGGIYVYQEIMIELLSKTLPSSIALYIKEHPVQRLHGRSESFYEQIKSYPHVHLIKESVSSIELIKNSLAVATITGTAGWEALFQGKPSLIFGNVFFQYAPGAYRVRNQEDLAAALKCIFETAADKNLLQPLRMFLHEIEKILVRGWIDPVYEKISEISYDENLKNMTRALVEKIKIRA